MEQNREPRNKPIFIWQINLRQQSQEYTVGKKHRLFFFFLGLHLLHTEVPWPGVELELQLPAYTTATATLDLSCVCHLHHSSGQCGILNPLSKARARTHNLTVTSRIRICRVMTGTPGQYVSIDSLHENNFIISISSFLFPG